MKAVKGLFGTFLVLIQTNLAVAQRPTAAEYHSTSVSADGTTVYGYSSLEGTMSGSFPPGAIRHTYTTGFSLIAPNGSGISPVSCWNSQAGNPSYNFDPTCSDNISAIGEGIYLMNRSESAVCSYAGTFYFEQLASLYLCTCLPEYVVEWFVELPIRRFDHWKLANRTVVSGRL